ncbi:MAG: phosphoribosylglycinamide formyltransferase [Rhodobacter sp.]|nr:phosphoribosylglycinamide formyltransferase [Rhodobacter sp.]MCY4243389.1 phosphoribosylglycinamide formyltransferase [Rhodobacter sp.]
MSKRVAILISGGGTNMAALSDGMVKRNVARPVLVLSNERDARGLERAARRNIPHSVVCHGDYRDRASFEAAVLAELDAARPDIICLAGFMRILSPDFIGRYQGRVLNIHPSLLPRHKGLDTHARALEVGDAEHGCTVHLVTERLDDGPVLGQARIPVRPEDTPESLAARVREQERGLYPAVLDRFARGDRRPVFRTHSDCRVC